MWANEMEAASLSGYSPEVFRTELPELERDGFPKKSLRNGLRFIPAIIHFWEQDVDSERKKHLESTSQNIRDYEDL